MKILKSEIKDNFVNFEVEFDSKEVKEFEEKFLVEYAKKIKVNGYRKGKVPLQFVRKQVSKSELEQKTLEQLTKKYLVEVENSNECKNCDAEITNG